MKYSKFTTILVFILSLLFLSSPQVVFAQSSEVYYDYLEEEEWEDYEQEAEVIRDPHESMNRKFFNLNDFLIEKVLSPVSKGYDFIVPKKVRGSINNFFTNAKTPIRLFNNLFQGKVKGAGIELSRALINTTVGLGGLFDPATAHFNLELQDEDFDQTLGAWGLGTGSYYVFPFAGPTTTRGILGFIGDAALNPLTWLGVYDVDPSEAVTGAGAVSRVNSYSYSFRDKYKNMKKSAIDPYSAIKHAYIQNREKKIKE